jgi:hypothetical protein
MLINATIGLWPELATATYQGLWKRSTTLAALFVRVIIYRK